MTELMKQLQQWANEGRYDWENYTFGDLNKELILRASMRYDAGDPTGIGHIKNVLDGTIQVWRPVEHYPLPISKKYHANSIQCFESNDEDILVFVDDPQGYFMTVTTLFYRIEDIVTFKLTDKIDATFPFYAKGIERITHWQHLPQPPQKGGE